MNSNPLIRLKNAGITRKGRWLVRGVDLTIAAGEIVTLIGPNGSGKSTTAKMALGIIKPDEGEYERSNGLKVGYVPQKLVVDWSLPLTVAKFMNLTKRLTKADRSSAMEEAGVAHLHNSNMQELSGGEFQRVLLARAIALKPDLLVLDEPVQGVDFNGEAALYELIGQVRDRLGCGVLMISHDLHVVMAATDRVLCLNGHVCCSGSPSDVALDDNYIKLFGERAGRVLAVYQHAHDHEHLPDGRVRHADGSITDHCHSLDGHHHAENHDKPQSSIKGQKHNG